MIELASLTATDVKKYVNDASQLPIGTVIASGNWCAILRPDPIHPFLPRMTS